MASTQYSDHDAEMAGLRTQLKQTSDQTENYRELLAESSHKASELESILFKINHEVDTIKAWVLEREREERNLQSELQKLEDDIKSRVEQKKAEIQVLNHRLVLRESTKDQCQGMAEEVERLRTLLRARQEEINNVEQSVLETRTATVRVVEEVRADREVVSAGRRSEEEVVDRLENTAAAFNLVKEQLLEQCTQLEEEARIVERLYGMEEQHSQLKDQLQREEYDLNLMVLEKAKLEEELTISKERIQEAEERTRRLQEEMENCREQVKVTFNQREETRKKVLDSFLHTYLNTCSDGSIQ